MKFLNNICLLSSSNRLLLNAYLHFEALTEHSYDFTCVSCGFHPPVLIADLNRRVGFKCCTSDDSIPDKEDDSSDYVDCQKFWNKDQTNMIMRGFSLNVSLEF